MQLPNLSKAREIAAGGEGKIYEHPTKPALVIKLYHSPRSADFEPHLKALSQLGDCFVKPKDVYKKDDKVLGFSMDYVNLNDYWIFSNLFNKGFCNTNKITHDFKLGVLKVLAKELAQIHAQNIVVGDLNQYNLFVSKQGTILFVDVDSYQTPVQNHSGVLLDDIRDYVTGVINSASDTWAYDILAFWATTFCHPFKWVVPGNTESLEQRVRAQRSILSKIGGIKIPPLYQSPDKEVAKQFTEIFQGRRYFVDFSQAPMQAPLLVTPIMNARSSSSLRCTHMLSDITELHNGDVQCTIKVNNRWELLSTSTKGTHGIRTILPDCEQAYPGTAAGMYAYVKDKALYGVKESIQGQCCVQFTTPNYYYNNGSLIVVDSTEDLSRVFFINGQLAGSFAYSQTPIFAKSVSFRSSPIQNFGATKMLMTPNLRFCSLVTVPADTKDAGYCDGFYAVECKHKNKVAFYLSPSNSSWKYSLDYLPYFAVKGNYVFIPQDGAITLLDKHGNLVATYPLPICTRDSKLYSTAAGILLLESNSLYLINSN